MISNDAFYLKNLSWFTRNGILVITVVFFLVVIILNFKTYPIIVKEKVEIQRFAINRNNETSYFYGCKIISFNNLGLNDEIALKDVKVKLDKYHFDKYGMLHGSINLNDEANLYEKNTSLYGIIQWDSLVTSKTIKLPQELKYSGEIYITLKKNFLYSIFNIKRG